MKNENCASISMLDRTVDDVSFSKSRKKFDQNANVHEKQNEPITIFDRLNSQNKFSEKFSDSIDNKSSVDFDYSRDNWKTDEIDEKKKSDDANDNNNCNDCTLKNKL